MSDADAERLTGQLDDIATAIELLVDGRAENHGPLGIMYRLREAERRELQEILDRLRAAVK